MTMLYLILQAPFISRDGAEAKWTAKYMRSNDEVREVVNTLMELAFIAPHPSLHAGKVRTGWHMAY